MIFAQAVIDKKLTFRQQNVMGKELIYKIVYYVKISYYGKI